MTKWRRTIVVDFHGVVVNPQPVKQTVAHRLYRVKFAEWLFKREIAVARRLLTNEKYERLLRWVFEDVETFLTAPPVPWAIETLERLMHDGYRVKIVTSSGPAAFATAIAWCAHQDRLRGSDLLTRRIPLLSVDRNKPKKELVNPDDLVLDDSIVRLRELAEDGHDPRLLFLLTQPYNHYVDESGIAQRVRDWNDFEILARSLFRRP